MNPAGRSVSGRGAEGRSGAVDRMIARYRSWPRAMRWVAWATVFVVAYIVADELVLKKTNELLVKADAIEAKLNQYATLDEDTIEFVEAGHARWGAVTLTDAYGKNQLFTLCRQILTDEGVTPTLEDGQNRKLATGNDELNITAAPVVVQFRAAPNVVTAALARLEQSPIVARVSDVRIRRLSDEPLLDVTLTVETWIDESKG